MPIRKGDLLIYKNVECPEYWGSLAIATTDEYNDESCDVSGRGIDIAWISVVPRLAEFTDFNVTCFDKIGHIDLRKRK